MVELLSLVETFVEVVVEWKIRFRLRLLLKLRIDLIMWIGHIVVFVGGIGRKGLVIVVPFVVATLIM